MDETDNLPDILWSRIRESERTAPDDRPVVLVVEDDPDTRLLMRYALRTIVRTDAASSVSDALRMAEAVPYDGLLVDIRLPDGVGTQVVQDLRDRTPYWGVPMVAVTAYGLPNESGDFLNAGFDAYVAKPFEQDELRRLVNHLVVDPDDAVVRGRVLSRQDASEPVSKDRSSQQAPETQRLEAVPDA